MFPFFSAVPELILWGCAFLVLATAIIGFVVGQQSRRLRKEIDKLSSTIHSPVTPSHLERHQGLSLANVDELRARGSQLDGLPRDWWEHIYGSIEGYTSPEEHDGWFLTDRARNILSHDIVIGRQFHSAFFGSIPGLLTGAGLTLTFVAILLALATVHFNKGDAANPITGIDHLIDGLSGKFLSSIVALLLSILFTLYEKRVVRKLRLRYEHLVTSISDAIYRICRHPAFFLISSASRLSRPSLSATSAVRWWIDLWDRGRDAHC